MRVLRRAHWTAVLVRGELDLESRRRLEGQLRTELVRGKPVIVELAGLDFSDANGLRSLQRVVDAGAALDPPVTVELHGARGQVARLIQTLGMEGLIDPDRMGLTA
jgi:anti-anti-sigma regulatory factor